MEETILFVFKGTDQIIMARVESETETELKIIDYTEIRFMQTAPQVMAPIPFAFPAAFVDNLLSDEGKNKLITITKDNIYLYREKEIGKGSLDFFQRVKAKKSGIDIVGAIPDNLKHIN